MEWLEKLENQSLKNSAEKGTLLTEQQLKKVQNECGSIKRPPFSYMHLVMLAINSTTDKRMTLQEIYRWIETTFPYFKYHAKAGWKNSIRHNLSLYNIFVREPAINADDNNTKSKLSYWTIKTDKVGYRKKNRKPSDTSKKRAPRPIMPNLPHIHVMPVTGQSSTSKPYMMLKATIPGHTPILPKPSNDCPVFTGVVTVSTKNNCKNAADHDRTPTTPQITVSDASAPSVQPITSTPVCGEKTVPKINRKRHQNNKQEAQTTTTRQTSSKHAKTERGLSVEMPHVYLSPSFMDCSNIQSPSNDWSIFNLRQQHPLPRNFSDSGIEMPIDLSGFTTESTPGKLRPPHEFASTEKHSRKSRKPRSSSCGIGSNNGRNAQAVNCNKENGLLTQHRAEVGVKVESQFVVDSSAAVRFDEPDSSFHEKSLIDFDAFQSLRSHVLLTPPRLATKSSDATMKTSTPHKETFLTLKSSSPKWNGGAAAVCTPLKRVTTPFKPSTPKNTIETPADTALNTPAQIRLDSSHLESPVTPRNNTGVSSSRNKISPSPGRLLNSSFGMMPLTGFTPLRGIRQISGINDSFGDVFPDLQLDDQLLHDNGVMPIDLGNLSWLTNADLTDSHLEISHH
ncbi:uncharacterized protein LOC141912764 [Tubulanus polymorphus]|uniref:uncharacterized protein LOC141912764 n=1 Tax=Tubulanus polymorphus TaxID=672921 RepID=UPI003DA28B64